MTDRSYEGNSDAVDSSMELNHRKWLLQVQEIEGNRQILRKKAGTRRDDK